MPTPRIRRTLTALTLALGAGLASLAATAPALADSDVGSTTGGPLVESTPLVPGGPVIPDLPTNLPRPSLSPPDTEESGDGDDSEEGCDEEGCDDEETSPAEPDDLPIDGCTIETPCGPEEEWTELDSGCSVHPDSPGHVYCPGDEHPREVDEDGCYVHNDHVYCLGDGPGECAGTDACPDTGEERGCPVTRVAEECLPDSDPSGDPGETPEETPGETPGETPEETPGETPRADRSGGLPVTGPALAALAGLGVLLTVVGGGGLLLYQRRAHPDD